MSKRQGQRSLLAFLIVSCGKVVIQLIGIRGMSARVGQYIHASEGRYMEDKDSLESRRRNEFLAELLQGVTDPIHRRLIEAYQGDDPVQSMESELCKILMEVLRHED
jgi:hypothetical protein